VGYALIINYIALYMKKIFLLALALFVFTSGYSQQSEFNKLQLLTKAGIKEAYISSVRMWAFDTVKNQQAGPQFSGVVVSSDGYIFTAAHVNTPKQTYMVTFPDGKTCIAGGLGDIELEKTPMMPDVAIMKIITPGNWPHSEIGWSSAVKINEPVISIAYPETLNQSQPLVRVGSITKVINEYGFLQSSCKMEPGDSGGPLFDYLGRVIGLHSAINGDIDYEVPVDLYRKYWTALSTPKTYKTLPEKEDMVGKDRLSLLSIQELGNINQNFLKFSKRLDQGVVNLSSTIGEKEYHILGTLIKVPGNIYIISKRSMIGMNPVVKLRNGDRISVNTVYQDKDTDLILLETVSKLKDGLELSSFVKEFINEDRLGNFIISIQPEGVLSQFSVIGSSNFKLEKASAMGYLGAAVAFKEPVAITVVQPGSPAANGDFQIGDQLVSINGIVIKKPEDYGNQLIKYWAGDTLQFDLLRESTSISKKIVLGTRPERPTTHPADLFKGGKSTRRDGFDNVFAHGGDITPEQCGGPVFNLLGKFYGVNIARFSRTSTLVIPAATILTFLKAALPRINIQ
jgi:serine protease Do